MRIAYLVNQGFDCRIISILLFFIHSQLRHSTHFQIFLEVKIDKPIPGMRAEIVT